MFENRNNQDFDIRAVGEETDGEHFKGWLRKGRWEILARGGGRCLVSVYSCVCKST